VSSRVSIQLAQWIWAAAGNAGPRTMKAVTSAEMCLATAFTNGTHSRIIPKSSDNHYRSPGLKISVTGGTCRIQPLS